MVMFNVYLLRQLMIDKPWREWKITHAWDKKVETWHHENGMRREGWEAFGKQGGINETAIFTCMRGNVCTVCSSSLSKDLVRKLGVLGNV